MRKISQIKKIKRPNTKRPKRKKVKYLREKEKKS